MKAVVEIVVFKELGRFLNTREAVTTLMEILNKNQGAEIELDFSEVEFMSRSFADQFHKEKISFQEKSSSVIHITNANEEIIRILQAVSHTQNKKEREFIQIPVYKFSDQSLLSKYLLSI